MFGISVANQAELHLSWDENVDQLDSEIDKIQSEKSRDIFLQSKN